jgi:putative nucleotidyltransferase with HDIG domain
MAAMSPELSKALLDAIDGMQAFPASVQSILRLTGDASCAPRDLVEVIQNDPIVTIKVLRVVNSAYYSLPKQITSIERAVVFLGFNTIKNLAISIAALSLLPNQALAVFDAKRYVHHSLTTASIARALGARFPAIDAHDFFIAGLLHDFGKVVLAQVMPAQFAQAQEFSLWHEVPLHQALREVTGIDHAEVGAMLLEKWRFPATLVDAIRWQYTSAEHASVIAVCMFAANQICKYTGTDFAITSKPEALSPAMEQILGGTLDSIIESLGDVSAILQEATQFSDL